MIGSPHDCVSVHESILDDLNFELYGNGFALLLFRALPTHSNTTNCIPIRRNAWLASNAQIAEISMTTVHIFRMIQSFRCGRGTPNAAPLIEKHMYFAILLHLTRGAQRNGTHTPMSQHLMWIDDNFIAHDLRPQFVDTRVLLVVVRTTTSCTRIRKLNRTTDTNTRTAAVAVYKC